MALVTTTSSVIRLEKQHHQHQHRGQILSTPKSMLYSIFISPPTTDKAFFLLPQLRCRVLPSLSNSIITCSAANKPEGISSTAKIRSEVLSPFRTVRMFFYVAFIASGSLGGLIAVSQLIGALRNASRGAQVPDIAWGLGIDIAAVALFSFLYSIDNNANNTQLARLSREENLSKLQVRIDEKRVIPVSSLRGIARLVIVAGPSSFIAECFKLSQPYTERLVERGILVVAFATDGSNPPMDENEELDPSNKRRRLWQLNPVFPAEWSKWLDEQKKIARVSPPESPVYLSLRLDGRVRGSGVGYPPWNAFVVQIPPMKGMWLGLLDGMDGRVL